MKYLIDIEDTKTDFANELFKNISFIKNIKVIESNEIVNPVISKSIEDFEQGKLIPTPLNLAELKAIVDA